MGIPKCEKEKEDFSIDPLVLKAKSMTNILCIFQ